MLLKSIFSNTVPGLLSASNSARAAWPAASVPFFVPIPSWTVPYESERSSFVRCPTNLETNCRRVSPTAMGWMPPPGLVKANRLAPKNVERMQGGTSPATTTSTKLQRLITSRLAASPLVCPMRSLRIWGCIPSGPPALPHGKDATSRRRTTGVQGSGCELSGGAWSCRSAGRLGCLDCSLSTVSGVLSAMVSLEDANRMAPLTSPSSILSATAVASRARSSRLTPGRLLPSER